MKVAVIIVHFGGLPDWFPLWRHTAMCNPQIDFHLFSDANHSSDARNITRHKLLLKDFNEFPSVRALGLYLRRPYKVCDFRPAFGTIFSEVIASYDYWGWGDLDVIYGDISGCLHEKFGICDYIATGWNGESGPLAFLKNTDQVNKLFLKIGDYQQRMNDTIYHGLDEIDFLEVLKRNVSCDIYFRECLLDLPARLRDGKLESVITCREYVLYHFGGRKAFLRKRIIRRLPHLVRSLERGDSIYIRKGGQMKTDDGILHNFLGSVFRKLSRKAT